MTGMVEKVTFRTDRMRALAESGFATATDLADWLVREANVPFREAHHITGRAVKLAETEGTPLADLPLDKLQAIDSQIDGRIFGVLTVDASVGSRKSHGGTSPDRSEEHTSELQSLMRISYAVFCLKKKTTTRN